MTHVTRANKKGNTTTVRVCAEIPLQYCTECTASSRTLVLETESSPERGHGQTATRGFSERVCLSVQLCVSCIVRNGRLKSTMKTSCIHESGERDTAKSFGKASLRQHKQGETRIRVFPCLWETPAQTKENSRLRMHSHELDERGHSQMLW